MAISLVVGDWSGKKLAELDAEVGPVSWRLNDVGRATFSLKRGSSKATEANLSFGNRVLVQFDNGLPNWAGVLDPPRKWSDKRVYLTAYSGEYLLGWRQTDKGRYFENRTVGEIFMSLVNEANSPYSLGISVGEVYLGGIGHWPDYHFDNVLKIIRDSLCSKLSTFDYAVTGQEEGGVIRFTASLWERRGQVKANVVLDSSKNLYQCSSTEQGEIINSWDLAGSGNGWGDERPTSHEQDEVSISRYGYRQGSQVFADVSVQETLDAHAATLRSVYKDPHAMMDLSALNVAPGRFADYEVGDSVTVDAWELGFGGFRGLVRVEGREFDPRTQLCRLAVREVV